LSAGFYRSREFLADRMACCLYGSDVFATALSKVCTDGTLFEMTMYENINQLLEKQQSFINMYDAFKSFRDEQMSRTEREELYQKLLNEEGSLFASHPTFGERMEAVASLPRAAQIDGRSARELFEDPEAVEKELTQFLTEYMYAVQQIQAQAAAEAQA
jgi:Zn-dependent protease with chaperone function